MTRVLRGAAGLSLFCLVMVSGGLAAGRAGTPPSDLAQVEGDLPTTIQADTTAPRQNRTSDALLFEADTWLDEGKFAQAVEVLRRLLKAEPGRVDALERLAGAYRKWLVVEPGAPDSLTQEALRTYRAILDLKPRHREALEGIRVLSGRFGGSVAAALPTAAARTSWSEAEAAAARGDYSRAAVALRRVAAAAPRLPVVHRRLAEALDRTGDRKGARREYERAVDLNPGDVAALLGLAALERRSGSPEAAEKLAVRAFEMADPDSAARAMLSALEDSLAAAAPTAERYFYQGRVRLAGGDAPAALVLLQRAVAADSTGPDYIKFAGIAQFDMQKYADALDLLTRAAQADPEDPDIQYYVGSIFYETSRYDMAIRHLLPVAGDPRYHGDAARRLGLALTHIRDHGSSAILYLEQAVRQGSTDPGIPCALGEEYVRAGRWSDARRELDKCVGRTPESVSALLGLGFLADHEGRPREAMTYLNRFLEQHPAMPAVLMKIGLIHLKLGDADSAAVRFRSAISADSAMTRLRPDTLTTPELFEVTFLVLMTGEQYDDGIRVGEYLVQTDTTNAGYANNLAMAYADADTGLARALELARLANRRSPDNSGYIDTLGWVSLRLRRYREAENLLNRSLHMALAEEDRDVSEIYYHLAVLASRTRRQAKAIELLQMTLQGQASPTVRRRAQELLDRLTSD